MSGPRSIAPARLAWLLPVVAVAALLGVRAAIVADPLDRLAAAPSGDGRVVYTGSILVARGGPVLFGYQGPGSSLWIDGTAADRECRPIFDGTVCRMLVPAGPAAIRFAATPGARLLWIPVGRRGDPEYVQPGSLSPDPPDRADFEADLDTADRAVGDGLVSAAILAIVIATLLVAARHRLALVPRHTWIAMAAVFAVAALARWIGLSDHGQTWDEDVNWASGRNYVTNLLSLDFHARSWTWNFEHPPVMKYLEGLGAQFADGYGPARALSAVWVAIGCALLVPIGKRLYGMRAGVLAGGIAALLPPLVAHGQIVGHEAPTVMWWALGILLALTALDEIDLESQQRRLLVRLAVIGVVAGLACASRFVNGLLGPTCLVIVVAVAPVGWRRLMLVPGLAVIAGAAALAIYAVWPRLWLHPIEMLAESLRKLAGTHSLEPFLGAMTATPGPLYFPLYLVATLPAGVLAGALAGAVSTMRRRTPVATRVAMAAWLVLPLAVMASPVRQDGVRYVLPSVMALAMLAAAGWGELAEQLTRRWRHAFAALAAALALYLGSVLWRTHPYYLDYFGEQVGGAETVAAHRWFETAWWGEGVDRAVAYVDDHAAPGDAVYRACIEPVHLAWFRADLWKTMTQDPRRARWLVAYAPLTAACAVPADARLVYEVVNDGLVLARVFHR